MMKSKRVAGVLGVLVLSILLSGVEGQEDSSRRVLRSSLAGFWYEKDPDRLREEIRGYLDAVEDSPLEGICAVILPHAGYRYSGQAAAHGIKPIAGRTWSRVIVIGPSHRTPMENMASIPDATHIATPLGEVPLDLEFIGSLRDHDMFGSVPYIHGGEHSVQIEIPLLQEALGKFRLVPIVVGQMDRKTAREMARVLRGLMDPETLVVVSTDFTHYGPNYRYVPFRQDVPERLEKLDRGALEAMQKGGADGFREYVKETGATICGREAVTLLLEMQPAEAKLHLLKYDTSGRITKDYSNSVSYMSIGMTGAWEKGSPAPAGVDPGKLTEGDKEALLILARAAIDHALAHQKMPTAEDLGAKPTGAMSARRAAFVTLEKDGALRGCIGGVYATRPLYLEVIFQAVAAAFGDNRFPRVQASEMEKIHLEISVLTRPQPVASAEEILIGRDGIILEKEGKRALFLPQVAPDQGWDLAETLRHLCVKAGLPPDGWKEGATFRVFQAEVFDEPEE